MHLYLFSSNTITNVWAGVGAGMWAVSTQQASHVTGAVAKASNMPIGAHGLIYCSATQSFTTPFLVASKPDPDRVIGEVWPEPWTLAFRILPLGTPRRQLHKDQMSSTLPSLRGQVRPWNHVLLISPTTVFVPSEVSEADWEAIILSLAGRASLGESPA